jgi:O-antigen ligase
MGTAAPVLPIERDSDVARARSWQPTVTGVAVLIGAVALSAESGGYFPRAWGLTALLLLWSAALALVLRDRIRLGRLEWLMIVALSSFALWTALSAYWGPSVSAPIREASRTLVYVAVLLAALLSVRATSVRSLLTGLWGAITLVCAYSLATKLFPVRLAEPEELAVNRLSEPLGWWNALGLFAGLGALLALGLVARGTHAMLRAAAAASTVLLLTTLYFTFSRGAWVAIAIGLVVAVVVDPRRLHLLTAALALAVPVGLALAFAYNSDALATRNPTLVDASSEGRSLAVALAGFAVLAAVLALLHTFSERRVHVTPLRRRIFAVALVVGLLAGVGAVLAAYGSPRTIADRVHESVDPSRPLSTSPVDTDQRSRLFTASREEGRVAQWEVAWETFRAHPWLGGGAGSYERYWNELRPSPFKVRDAFSLYLETLAEQGPVGLGLLTAALSVPVAAGLLARRRSLVPICLGGYAAFLVHAGLDFDWEMPIVTVTALVCAVAMLVLARERGAPVLSTRLRFGLLAVILPLSAFALVGLVGNSALAASEEAREDGNSERAEVHARKAIRWLPWSEEPWLELARAQRDQRELVAARASVRRAIAKEPDNWRLWYVLARVTRGKERDRAIARGLALNPLSPQIAELQTETAPGPGGLTVPAVSSSSVELAWWPLAGAASYNVERSSDGVGRWTRIASTTRTSHRDRGVIRGRRYYYRVRANIGTTLTAASLIVSAEPSVVASQAATRAPQGNWVRTYGGDGYVLAGWRGTSDLAPLQKASFVLEQGGRYLWKPSITRERRALLSPDGRYRRPATFQDASELRLRLVFKTAYAGTLHLYALDWDKRARRERIAIVGGPRTHTADLAMFDQGAWVHVPIRVAAGESVWIRVTRIAGPNAVLSGLFLGGPHDARKDK